MLRSGLFRMLIQDDLKARCELRFFILYQKKVWIKINNIKITKQKNNLQIPKFPLNTGKMKTPKYFTKIILY
jgi:hypothetical protein